MDRRALARVREAADKTAVVMGEEGLEQLKRTQKTALLKFAEIMLRLEEEGKTSPTFFRLDCNSGIPTRLTEEPRLPPIVHVL